MNFQQWQISEHNQWSHQDEYSQRMMFSMWSRGFEVVG